MPASCGFWVGGAALGALLTKTGWGQRGRGAQFQGPRQRQEPGLMGHLGLDRGCLSSNNGLEAESSPCTICTGPLPACSLPVLSGVGREGQHL